MRRPHYIAAISIVHPDPTGQLRRAAHLSMRNLSFGFFDDCGLPREARILIFYSFETDERLPRSGILHYHVGEGRFVGPRHDRELTSAALQFLSQAGRIQTDASQSSLETGGRCVAPPTYPDR
jgi:hypothetical protein